MKTLVRIAQLLLPLGIRQCAKRRLQDYFDVPTIERSLENMRELGFRPTSAVDVGAYHGEWTFLFRRVFPECSVLMLEAQSEQAAHLERVRQTCPEKLSYRTSVIGPEDREEVLFNQYTHPTDASVLSILKPDSARAGRCRMETLDSILRAATMPAPDFIKVDVQGYELEVLKGASDCLKSVKALLLEVSMVKLYEGSPLLDEVIDFLRERKFVVYDICGLMRKPGSSVLAQADILFVPTDSPFRSSTAAPSAR